jgi:hypothetical protein
LPLSFVVALLVTLVLSNVEIAMLGRTPCDVPSVTVPLTMNVAGGRETVRWAMPLTFWYVAVTSAVPALTPVTTPELVTDATDVLDDCQVDCEVTVCVVLLESAAVAVNCALAPTLGADPVTLMAETVGVAGLGVTGGDIDDEPPEHAMTNTANRRAMPDAVRMRGNASSWVRQ